MRFCFWRGKPLQHPCLLSASGLSLSNFSCIGGAKESKEGNDNKYLGTYLRDYIRGHEEELKSPSGIKSKNGTRLVASVEVAKGHSMQSPSGLSRIQSSTPV